MHWLILSIIVCIVIIIGFLIAYVLCHKPKRHGAPAPILVLEEYEPPLLRTA